jgi:hypothetical protein
VRGGLVDISYWPGMVPNDALQNWMQPYVEKCYSRTALVDGLFYLGGDGGNNQACIWPSPPAP